MTLDTQGAIGLHHKTGHQMLDESLAAIHDWFNKQEARDDISGIVHRTSLQLGIHDEILLEYDPSRIVFDLSPDWSPNGEDGLRPQGRNGPLSPEQVQEYLAPPLADAVRERIAKLQGSGLLNHTFRFRAQFPTTGGRLRLTLVEHVDEAKRQLLRDRVQAYVDQTLFHGSHPTNRLDVFFLTRHLLDKPLFPAPDPAWLIRIFQRVLELNAGQPSLDEQRHSIIHALRSWAETQYLPHYFSIEQNAFRQNVYHAKPGAMLDPADRDVDLLLYAAMLILRHEPGYSRPTGLGFLELAQQLGSERAARMLTEGSGAHPPEHLRISTPEFDGAANDVLSTITVHIRQECAAAYQRALAFITRLLQTGFPPGYQLSVKSKTRNYLPVKGLAKSDTHRFFANAAQYPDAHEALATYARAAIKPYEWYTDADDEKACLAGTYATFALGLADARHFALVTHYMDLVDDEHQSAQDRFTPLFIQQHGLTPASVDTIVACVRRCTDNFKLSGKPALDDDATLDRLIQALGSLPEYEAPLVRERLCGPDKKLAAEARKADPERRARLLRLLGQNGA